MGDFQSGISPSLTVLYSTTATSHTFGKLLERQPADRLSRLFCRTSRRPQIVRCQALSQLSLALSNHLDTFSGALRSLNSLTMYILLARQRLQHRVEAAVATIIRTTDLPADSDCNLFLALWNLFQQDGEGSPSSVRNTAAFPSFCAHLTHLGRRLDQDMASIRILEGVLATFRLAQAAGSHPNIEPPFSMKLIERVEAILQLRMTGRQGHIDDRHYITIEAR